MKAIKLLSILVLLCVLKVRSDSDSIWVDGEGWVDYEFGHVHTISAATSPVNVSLSQSAVVLEFFAQESDSFYYDLGDLRDFAVLASTDVTNTGNSSLQGGLGWDSNSSLADGLEVEGTIEEFNSTVTDSALAGAEWLLSEAQGENFTCNNLYNDSNSNNLGGQSLPTGASCWTWDDLYIVGGDLILDGGGSDDAFWVIRVNGRLTVGSWGNPVQVRLVNGGSPCNVYWFVGSDVVIHSGSSFIGVLISGGNVVLNEYATVTGSVVSTTGSVSLYENSIDNSCCANGTRQDFNTSFVIWPAITIPIDLGEEDQLVVLNDQSNGFEIVSSGSISALNFFIPPLSDSQAGLLNNSDFTFQVWFLSSFTSACSVATVQRFEGVEQVSDGGFIFRSGVTSGTFFFVLVRNEEQQQNETSSSSTGGGGGGIPDSSSSSTGVESSSTAVESSTAVASSSSSTGIIESSTGVESSSSSPFPSLSSSGHVPCTGGAA